MCLIIFIRHQSHDHRVFMCDSLYSSATSLMVTESLCVTHCIHPPPVSWSPSLHVWLTVFIRHQSHDHWVFMCDSLYSAATSLVVSESSCVTHCIQLPPVSWSPSLHVWLTVFSRHQSHGHRVFMCDSLYSAATNLVVSGSSGGSPFITGHQPSGHGMTTGSIYTQPPLIPGPSGQCDPTVKGLEKRSVCCNPTCRPWICMLTILVTKFFISSHTP